MTLPSSHRPSIAPSPNGRWAVVQAMALAVVAAGVYVLLRQDVTHEFDVYWMLPRIEDGALENARHPLSFYLAHSLASLLDGFGSVHERLKIASGLCVGLAVGILAHAAWLLCRKLSTALLVALVFAALPTTVRFATVMELHGQFLPFAAAVLWLASAIAAGGFRWPVGLLLGGLSALATAVHSTGHLLVGFVSLWLLLSWWRARVPMRRVVAALGSFVVVHAVGSQLISLWAVADGGAAASASAQLETLAPRTFSSSGLWATVVGEWLWPYLPLSVLWLRSLWPRPSALVVAFSLALLANLAACQSLLARPGPGYIFFEFGAYQLPIAFAAVVITVVALGPRMRIALLIGTLALSAYHWRYPGKPIADPVFAAAAVDYLQGNEVRLLVGDADEFDGTYALLRQQDALRSRYQDLVCVRQFVLTAQVLGATRSDELALGLHPKLIGRETVLTDSAMELLRQQGGIFTELVERSLPAVFELVPVERSLPGGGHLSGVRLRPRP